MNNVCSIIVKKYFNFTKTLPYMEQSLSDFIVNSISLTNSSHCDFNDDTMTVTTWVEDHPGNSNNWYLVSLQNCSKGTVVKLHHGCTVVWDASVIRHASSRVDYKQVSNSCLKLQSSGLCETRKRSRGNQ